MGRALCSVSFFDRKAAIAADFIQWQPKKRPERGTITEGMRERFAAYLPPEE